MSYPSGISKLGRDDCKSPDSLADTASAIHAAVKAACEQSPFVTCSTRPGEFYEEDGRVVFELPSLYVAVKPNDHPALMAKWVCEEGHFLLFGAMLETEAMK